MMSRSLRTYLGAATCAVVTAGCLLTAAGSAGADPGDQNAPSAGQNGPSPGVVTSAPPVTQPTPVTPSPTPAPTAGVDAPAASVVPDTPPRTVEEARQRIDALEQESASAAERANAARVRLSEAQARMDDQASKVAAVRVELSQQQRTLEQLARQIYVNGGMSNAAVSFALDDPEEFLADLDRLISASDSQSTVLMRTRANAVKLKEAADALERERDELVKATSELGAAEAEAATRLARSWQVLAELEEAERLRLAEEVRIAAETARLEAELTRQALDAQARSDQALAESGLTEQQTGVNARAGGGTSASVAGSAAGQQVSGTALQKVIDFALSKVGGRYVWGANGPDAYDCSGLTQMAWAQAGVRLTHYSGTQYAQTRPVALDAIQPGDLLYFYSINQHVGIYIGNGKFVHAANPNDGIRLDSLVGYYVDNLVAASRPGA